MCLTPIKKIGLVCFLGLLMACRIKVANKKDDAMQFDIDHYAINVTDLDKSVAFYKEIFDLEEIKNGTGLDHIRWFRLGKDKELHIIEVKDLDKKLPKGVHLALRTRDFKSFRESITLKNIAYSDWPGKLNEISIRPDGIKQLYFQDPDGYWIEVNDAR